MDQQEHSYRALAMVGQLHQWASHPRGGDDVVALGMVTRGDFKRMYTGQLARSGSHARPFYDRIKMSAPNNICPYCGFGAVETLDHFLAKGRYCSLAVLPMNLVPACSDCNRKKHDGVETAEGISSHPYFEESCVAVDEWLYASLIHSARPAATFHVMPPDTWDRAVAQRVTNHFDRFELAGRYATQASERLMVYAAVVHELVSAGAQDEVATHLQRGARTELRIGRNSWQAALAKAIANDIWFHTEGYRRLI
ncbi:HNH endonuclease signature motif containing protein [Pseudoxanthomonas sp. 10H]|uniref:HNH endonuclease signature motif containing protein n=1 Tax=Pseudoxanthomonas sp. 10H TaxID=3242729 RepID=UPI0035572E5A